MKNFGLTWLFVFLTTFLLSGAFAALIFVPMLGEPFGTYMRGAEDSGGMGVMMVGFVLLSLAITMLFAKLDPAMPAMTRGLQAGLWVAVVLVSDYLVVVGWSTMPMQPMIISGLVSAIAPVAGGLVAGLYNRNATA